jgi:DNA-binding XRE family transcriptional regulator
VLGQHGFQERRRYIRETPGGVLSGAGLWHFVPVKASEKIKPYPFRRTVYWGEDGEVYLTCSGEFGLKVARAFGPNAEDTRRMLLELRRRWSWSRATLAAVLGAPRDTVRRWEDGSRKPSGSATKLIWLIHTTFVKSAPVVNLYDLISWGHGTKTVFEIEK